MLILCEITCRVPSSQIWNPRNSEATYSAIIDEIKAFLFNDVIEERDLIMIYYAGHGGWVKTPTDWKVPGENS